jgi:hypothetical protein
MQHKGKTAEQIGQIGDVMLAKFTASSDKDVPNFKRLWITMDATLTKLATI